MTDLPNEIFKKYGFVAILAALVGATFIWGIAHLAASPGTEVSVLWGLVKYTKSSALSYDSGSLSKPSKNSNYTSQSSQLIGDAVSLPVTSLHVQNGVTAESMEKVLATLRKERGLRELTAMESGKKVSELPKGTLFFIPTGLLYSSDGRSSEDKLLILNGERYRANRFYSEIQNNLNEGIQVIGFVSEADAARISHLSGHEAQNISITPYLWGQLTSLISVPINRFQESTSRYVQSSENQENVLLDLKVK